MTSSSNNLRDEVASYVSRAIDSTQNYEGEEKIENRHNWVQITTDRVISALVAHMPIPIDIESRYELLPGSTLPVEVPEDTDAKQLDYLAAYSADQGYNKYYHDLMHQITGLYKAPSNDVSLRHD